MATGLADILTAIQHGVAALNNLGKQVFGSFNNIASQLAILNAAPAITAGPWTVWTPTVTSSIGAFTTVSASGRYFAIGKLVHFSITITITAAGTAAGSMTIALPVGTAANAAGAYGFTGAGFTVFGAIGTGGTTIFSILKYDNTTLIAGGVTVVVSGIYEQI